MDHTGTTIFSEYVNTQKFGTGNSGVSYNKHDDIPCSGKGGYNFDRIDNQQPYYGNPNQPNFMKKPQMNPAQMQQCNQIPEEDEFPDDFEDEYQSDEEENAHPDHDRVTDKANPAEMSSVLGLYEDLVKKAPKNLSTIREDSFETTASLKESGTSSDNQSVPRNVLFDKKKNMRNKLVEKLGVTPFEQIYTFVRASREKGVSDSQIKDTLKNKFGKNIERTVFEMDQLIFFEQMNNI